MSDKTRVVAPGSKSLKASTLIESAQAMLRDPACESEALRYLADAVYELVADFIDREELKRATREARLEKTLEELVRAAKVDVDGGGYSLPSAELARAKALLEEGSK